MAFDTELRGELRGWTGFWWLLLLVGVLSLAAGIIVLVESDISLATLSVVVGIFLLVDGIFEIAASLSRRTENRGLVALIGVLSVIAGVILVRHPIAGVVAAALLIGIWLIAVGIVRFITAFERPGRRVWPIVLGLLETIAGIVIVASPDIGVATLAILVGIAFILRGLGMSAVAWALHRVHTSIPPA
jgi:uncharacterized membrane protein HdeD (DUF308 family)